MSPLITILQVVSKLVSSSCYRQAMPVNTYKKLSNCCCQSCNKLPCRLPWSVLCSPGSLVFSDSFKLLTLKGIQNANKVLWSALGHFRLDACVSLVTSCILSYNWLHITAGYLVQSHSLFGCGNTINYLLQLSWILKCIIAFICCWKWF